MKRLCLVGFCVWLLLFSSATLAEQTSPVASPGTMAYGDKAPRGWEQREYTRDFKPSNEGQTFGLEKESGVNTAPLLSIDQPSITGQRW